MLIPLEHGQPIRFGAAGHKGVVMNDRGQLEIVEVAEVGESAILVHDERREDPGLAFALSRIAHGPYEPTPMGVFRAVERPDYGAMVDAQLLDAQSRKGPGDLRALLGSGTTW